MFLEEVNELFRENWSIFLTAGYLVFCKHISRLPGIKTRPFETATGQLAQWPPSNTTWFVSFATTTGQLAQWPPRNTTWFVSFATTTGQLAQWPPRNTTWFVYFETTRY